MKLLDAYVAYIMVEGKIDDAKKRYPDIADAIDEAGNGVESKYIDWIVKQLKRNEPANEINDALKSFSSANQRLERRDINSYKTLADVRDALASLTPSSTEKRSATKEESEIILHDGPITVIEPKSEAASCLYGKGTKWCISATRTKNYFDTYKEKGDRFFFIIDKSQPSTSNTAKLALVTNHRDSNPRKWFKVYDAHDRVLVVDDVIDLLGETLNKLLKIAYGSRWDEESQAAFDALTTKDEKQWIDQVSSIYSADASIIVDMFTNSNIDWSVKEKLARQDPGVLYNLIVTGHGCAPDWAVALALEEQNKEAIDDWIYEKDNYDNSPIGEQTFEAMIDFYPRLLARLFIDSMYSENETFVSHSQRDKALSNKELRKFIYDEAIKVKALAEEFYAKIRSGEMESINERTAVAHMKAAQKALSLLNNA